MIALIPGIVSSIAATAGANIAPLAGSIQNAPAANVGGASFGQLLDQLSGGAVDALKAGEAAAISGIQGKASLQQVVDTIMAAERTLQTTIAVRDKAVNAYQEISRMAI
ncbi:MAG: flagellar hook-basal body complex protein FliE [Methylocystis sp.]|nr:flagellar hook-basal body complex protein FliE [Methylocystis sp.]